MWQILFQTPTVSLSSNPWLLELFRVLIELGYLWRWGDSSLVILLACPALDEGGELLFSCTSHSIITLLNSDSLLYSATLNETNVLLERGSFSALTETAYEHAIGPHIRSQGAPYPSGTLPGTGRFHWGMRLPFLSFRWKSDARPAGYPAVPGP